ncbi:MAG: anti-sigma factor antagonist [Nitrospirota bacterium]|nr:anti-sigma factor antagonist [Nitrospirota bacterium]
MTIVAQVKDGLVQLALAGRMDFNTRSSFMMSIDQAAQPKPHSIILNFSDVTFIDSAGLGLLMLAKKKLEELQIRLKIEVTEGYVKEVFTLTNLGGEIPIVLIPPSVSPVGRKKQSGAFTPQPKPLLVCESDEMQELLLPILEQLEKKDLELPPLSHVAQQVLALTTDPDATLDRLITLIQQDPVLTARIFKVANSAAYGASRQIDSLSQAIVFLGLHSVTGLAFALSLQSGVFLDRGYEREVRGLWVHAIATAFYGKALASLMGKNPDTAFLSGLLHSLGKFFVVHTVNQSCPVSDPPLPWATMLMLMEQSSIEVGRQLAEAWNFPFPVKEAINLHQQYSYHLAVHPSKSAAITCLARHLATSHLDAVHLSHDIILALPVAASLNMTSEMMDGLLAMKDHIQPHLDSLLN